jgi:hypothetical protein
MLTVPEEKGTGNLRFSEAVELAKPLPKQILAVLPALVPGHCREI